MASYALALILRHKLKVIRNAERDANIRKNAYMSEGLNCRYVASGGGGVIVRYSSRRAAVVDSE